MKQILLFLLMLFPLYSNGQGQSIIEPVVMNEVVEPWIETIQLNSGREMPLCGIDLSSLTPVQAEIISYQAIYEGFRLLDLAGVPGNEEAVGRGIAKAIEEGIVTREDLFISAGIWLEEAEDMTEAGDAAIQDTLTRLGLDYLDLMILSQSRYDLDLAAYQAMERAAESGTVHSLGLAGFYDSRNFDLIVDQISVIPAVLQLEMHPYRQNNELKEHVMSYGTVVEAKDPLGGGDKQVLFADPAVSVSATWHQKTSEQIILRWQFQNGNIAIPSAVDDFQLEEYAGIGDFELDDKEMAEIDALDRGLIFVYY